MTQEDAYECLQVLPQHMNMNREGTGSSAVVVTQRSSRMITGSIYSWMSRNRTV
ncbi:hypothetical protein EGR_10638 [Echinococcus granulosus]|uniref:Uncharacterized protein n=1 Tax=Echinococcus granulosus TaxID=6210 RepID=W6U7Y6_ECHGR|nr:hypothetical protein EGR_10638 [Echinococcus granulosus]EUB54502.1 hypothetical protein EGR_10638 [Echinococcus granulosus]